MPNQLRAGDNIRLTKTISLPKTPGGSSLDYPGWVGFSLTGRYLGAAYQIGENTRVTVWDTTSYDVACDAEAVRMNARTEFGLRAAFHPEGSHILIFDPRLLRGIPLGSAKNGLLGRSVDRTAGRIAYRKMTYWVMKDKIRQVTVLDDNRLFVDCLDPQKMRFDGSDIERASSFTEESRTLLQAQPSRLVMDGSGSRILWSHHPTDGQSADVVRLLDLPTGKSTVLQSDRRIESVSCLAFAPSAQWGAAGGHDGMIRFWDLNNGAEKCCLSITEYTISAIAFSPNGKLAAIGGLRGGDANLVMMEMGTFKIQSVDKLEDGVIDLAFDPKGDRLAVLGSAKTVRIMELASTKGRKK